MWELKQKRLEEINERRKQWREEKFAVKKAKIEKARLRREARRQRQGDPGNQITTAKATDEFVFPDFDYEDEDDMKVHDGVPKFLGTVEYLKSLQSKTADTEIDLSDDDFEFSDSVDDGEITLSELETSGSGADQDVSQDQEMIEAASSHEVNVNIVLEEQSELLDQAECDEDDGPPVAEKIVKVTDIPEVSPEPSKKSTSLPEGKKCAKSKFDSDKSYLQILRRPKRDPTLMEKLLSSEIERERCELLQCLKYVCKDNFFGIGDHWSELKMIKIHTDSYSHWCF